MDFVNFYENLEKAIGRFVNIEIGETFNNMNIKFKNYECNFSKEEFDNIIQKIKVKQDCYLLMDGYYEIMLDNADDYRYYLPGGMRTVSEQYGNVYEDTENKISYSFGYASDEYLIAYFMDLRIYNGFLFWRVLERDLDENKECINIFSLLRIAFRNVKTLKIHTSESLDINTYNNYADAFLYNLTYNNNIVLKRAISFQARNVIESRRNRRMHEIIVPKRIYNPNLLEQYSIANSSMDPFIQFISYYHILEHFYESVYNEELINSLRLEMTSPSFSLKSDKNIAKIIDMVKKKTKQNNEEFDINECEALELLLRKNIKFDEIKEELNNLNITNIEVYNDKVKFCDGNKLNLHDVKDDSNYKNLAKRIYKIRNALVHYKADDKSSRELKVYKPFKDKNELFN